MKKHRLSFGSVVLGLLFAGWSVVGTGFAQAPAPRPYLLKPDAFQPLVEGFNREDKELYRNFYSNAVAWDFLKNNIPLFECPEQDLEEIYYFRWWTFRKHIKQTPDGFIITEFLPPVGWAGKYNSINCAAGHHLHEGRWLNDPRYLDDYSVFWFRRGGDPRRYSFWAAESMWARYLVTGDDRQIKDLLPDLISNYGAWETSHRGTNELFWQNDGNDGMEVAIGGTGFRPTINSYMYGDALAIANIAELCGQKIVVEQFRAKAAELKQLVQTRLWDEQDKFFKVIPKGSTRLAQVREELGYSPWYFGLPDADKSIAWKQLMDPQGFYAPFGPTTAEQRSPGFRIAYEGHECQWNGPSWPYSTSVTLTALANLLDDYDQKFVTRENYLELLRNYAKAQHLRRPDGAVVPWIDENLNPLTGDWIARTLLIQRGAVIPERGKDYNHSTFCDLIINGLVGIRPRPDNILEVAPLAPSAWDFFCLDQVRYHGHWLSICWDKTGDRYHKGSGLTIWADGKLIHREASLRKVRVALPGS